MPCTQKVKHLVQETPAQISRRVFSFAFAVLLERGCYFIPLEVAHFELTTRAAHI